MNDLGIQAISVEKMIMMLSKVYISLISTGVPFETFPSVMLWGPPGVGKSQGVHEIAYEIEKRTGKDVRITDVRLLLFNPVDLRGIPTKHMRVYQDEPTHSKIFIEFVALIIRNKIYTCLKDAMKELHK